MQNQVFRLSISLVIVALFAISGCANDANSNGPAGEPAASPTPDQPDDTRWAELLVTDKAYPEGEFEDPLFQLAEDEDEYRELWEWFEIGDPQTAVDAVSRVLAIAAHPDDELFGVGYLAKVVADGHELFLLCTTRGEGGT
jgi:hypothetical protein